jgi:hypothetical protein
MDSDRNKYFTIEDFVRTTVNEKKGCGHLKTSDGHKLV